MKKRKMISVLLTVIICAFVACSLCSCGEGSEEEHTCLKCNGSGKVRDEYGYYAYVTCPRCNGAGYLEY